MLIFSNDEGRQQRLNCEASLAGQTSPFVNRQPSLVASLLAVLPILVRMQNQIALAAVRPNQKQDAFSCRRGMKLTHAAVPSSTGCRSTPEITSPAVSPASSAALPGAHRLNHRALHAIGHVELLPQIPSQISRRESQSAFLFRPARCCSPFRSSLYGTRPRSRAVFAACRRAEFQAPRRSSRRHLAHRDLHRATVRDLLAVDLAQHIAAHKTGATRWRVRRHLAHDCARSIRQIKEACILRRHVVQVDAKVPVMHASALDNFLSRGLCNLRRNRESRSCKRSAARDDECVDADHFAVSIHQWPPELPGLMAASVWINAPGLRGSSR